MNLEVHNKRLEKILSDPNKLIKKVGLEMAQMIKKRFDELIAFSKVNDINLKECKNINIKGVVDYHEEKINWLIP